MPLYKGNKNINAIYKGTTQISAIYKGTILVYSSAFWQSLLYSYLYNDLIPTTIGNKNVLDKAKVSKIYANGVVENQLCNPTTSNYTQNGITCTNNGDGSYTLNGTATGSFSVSFNIGFYNSAILIQNHYYLLCGNKSGQPNLICHNMYDNGNGVIVQATATTTGRSVYTYIQSGTTLNNAIYKPQLIDLTPMFGAGNEPTALTDKRIQAILNHGYIPYNTGTYKGTSISEFSSKDSSDVALDTLSFIYQGNGALNAKDTYELTKDNHVFTKNVGIVDLGTLNISEVDSTIGYAKYYGYVSTPTPGYAAIPNIICQKYESASWRTIDNKSQDKIIGIGNDWQKQIIYDTGFIGKSSAEIKSSLSGVYLAYELATPQVITIPRKHLGKYTFNGSEYANVVNTNSQGVVTVLINLTYYSGVAGASNNNNYLVGLSTKTYQSATYNELNTLYYDGTYLIINVGKTSTNDTMQELIDKTLFYQTNAEVSDIADTISIEAGGSITSDSEVLPDVEFNVKCR